jgi:hypothetical protein
LFGCGPGEDARTDERTNGRTSILSSSPLPLRSRCASRLASDFRFFLLFLILFSCLSVPVSWFPGRQPSHKGACPALPWGSYLAGALPPARGAPENKRSLFKEHSQSSPPPSALLQTHEPPPPSPGKFICTLVDVTASFLRAYIIICKEFSTSSDIFAITDF